MRKLQKAKTLHPRDPRSPQHDEWRRHISEGMLQMAKRRRAAGLLTFVEVAYQTLRPVYAIQQMAHSGELKTVLLGARRFVPRSEVRRLKQAAA